jgi:hypothetical protein
LFLGQKSYGKHRKFQEKYDRTIIIEEGKIRPSYLTSSRRKQKCVKKKNGYIHPDPVFIC